MARLKLDEHVEGLNYQIIDLLDKIKYSNIKHSENAEKLSTLQNTILELRSVNYFNFFFAFLFY